MSTKFKVGDKVRYTHTKEGTDVSFEIGEEFIIDEVSVPSQTIHHTVEVLYLKKGKDNGHLKVS